MTEKFVLYLDGEEFKSFGYTDDEEREDAYAEAVTLLEELEGKFKSDSKAHTIIIYDEVYDGDLLTFKELHMKVETEADDELLKELEYEDHINHEVHLMLEDRA